MCYIVCMRTEVIKDKYGEFYKVTYMIDGEVYTDMGGNREAVEQSAKDRIARYESQMRKYLAKINNYGWA